MTIKLTTSEQHTRHIDRKYAMLNQQVSMIHHQSQYYRNVHSAPVEWLNENSY